MSYTTITVTPISPKIGAEIGNIDLTKPLSRKEVEELHKAFVQYQVIFFRDQKISHEDQIRLGRYFGELGRHVGVSHVALVGLEPFRHPAREVVAHRAPGQRGESAGGRVELAALGQGQGSRVGQGAPPVGGEGLGGAL